MPRRLILAAEIVSDVVRSSRDPAFERLFDVADDLRSTARELGDRTGIDVGFCTEMERLEPVIRRLAAALDPEAEARPDEFG